MTTYTQARHFLTARDTDDRLTAQRTLTLQEKPESVAATVLVDPTKRFQIMEGFGGAFTEAAAVTLGKLSPANRERALRAYFDHKEGHAYSLCRTHIGSC